MAGRHPNPRVNAAKDKLRAALGKLPPDVRKALAEMAQRRLKELDDPESETSKGVRRTAESVYRFAEVLRALPDNRTRARVLAEFVKENE